MSDNESLPPRSTSEDTVFIGPNGIRAGWRLLVAAAIFVFLVVALGLIVPAALRLFRIRISGTLTAGGILFGEGITLAACLCTAWIMSRIEARRFEDYGFGAKGAFGPLFWVGAAGGFGALSLLLGWLRLLGVYHLGPMALHGGAAAKYAVFWGVTFIVVGALEETLFRGYLLFTLTTGLTFWPAAMLTSVIFGASHLRNGGENRVGVLSVAAVGLFLCILIRKAGNLWQAIGFHFAWDWGESYFYGTPDSGLVAPGHLFSAQFSGPSWATGGSAGPEASWLCVGLLVLLCVAASRIPGAKYPNPEAIPDPRRRRLESPAPLFKDAATGSQP